MKRAVSTLLEKKKAKMVDLINVDMKVWKSSFIKFSTDWNYDDSVTEKNLRIFRPDFIS